MSFNSLDDLIAGMAAGSYRVPINRTSIASVVAGSEASLWRASNFPAQGAIPGAAATCDELTVGALPLAPRSGAEERIISGMSMQSAAAGHTLLLEDRLMHMGGLSGTVTTAQTVNVDVEANLAVDNLAERIGAADYSELEWYVEWYTATGATGVTLTVNVTFHDGTTGVVNVWVLGGTVLPSTVNTGRRYKLVPNNGKFIKSAQSCALSATTGAAGNFGVTVVRRLCEFEATVANALQVRDWTFLTAPKVADNACLTFAQMCITTTTGAWLGTVKQAVK